MPVPASQLPYAHFKNVTGVVSTSAAVYSLDKLNILNTLIDRLRSTRTDALASRESQGSSLTEERIDALIQQYGQELHAAVAANALPYTKPVGVVPGMLLSMAA